MLFGYQLQETRNENLEDRLSLVRFMVLSGFTTQAVCVETGINPKMVRKVRRDLLESGYNIMPRWKFVLEHSLLDFKEVRHMIHGLKGGLQQ